MSFPAFSPKIQKNMPFPEKRRIYHWKDVGAACRHRKILIQEDIMCGIAGFYQPDRKEEHNREEFCALLNRMKQALWRRGPDDSGIWLKQWAGLAHTRLAIIDPSGGKQPMIRREGGYETAIAYNGELYNTSELRQELLASGRTLETSSDTEVILNAYLEYGLEFLSRLNGIFALAIVDFRTKRLLLARDRAGVKPLFYAKTKSSLFFSSEIKGLFACPEIKPRLSLRGLQEIFALGPARIPGSGIFQGVSEVLPGHYLLCQEDSICQKPYWKLESRPHEDSFEDTVEYTGFLLQDAIRRQMVSDVPICTFLSGGIDSSLVSAVCAQELKKQGKRLMTFSFDFTGNDQFFQANAFQPSQDRPYVEMMVKNLDSSHQYLECSTLDQARGLFDSVLAHDLPSMADVDSSMLHFCSLVKASCKVALTGECADEIFGGYPWFYSEEAFRRHAFPWSMEMAPRQVLLKDEVISDLRMDEFSCEIYEESRSKTPYLDGESPDKRRQREISWLNLTWFMQTLLNRMDRTSMYSGLEARVPFADHRIIEYLWNVPWSMKTAGGMAKGLLRQAAGDLLPKEILYRKKSPYPKSYDTGYEALLGKWVLEMAQDPSSPIMTFFAKEKLLEFLSAPSDYGKPWYGQLMAGPQMLAYILQIDFWLKHYHIQIL